MKKFISLLPLLILVSTASFAFAADDNSDTDEGYTLSRELVVAPEGLITNLYRATGTVSYGKDLDHYKDADLVISIGFDGDDVYVKGLFYCDPNAWIKGQRNGSKIIFPNGQYLGKHTFLDNAEHEVWLYSFYEMKWEYDEATGDIWPWKGDPGLRTDPFDWVENFMLKDIQSFSLTTNLGQQLVCPPADKESVAINICTSGTTDHTSFNLLEGEILFDDEDVYVRNLCYLMNGTWIKGRITDDHTIAFPSNQFLGIMVGSYYHTYGTWFSGVLGKDVLFDYDPEYNILSLADELYVETTTEYSAENNWSHISQSRKTQIIPCKSIEQTPAEVIPSGTNRYEATISYYTYDHRSTEVYIDGKDVYVKGFCADFADSWIKGVFVDEKTVSFASGQYLGRNQDDEPIWFVAMNNHDQLFMTWDNGRNAFCSDESTIGFALCTSQGKYTDYCYTVEITLSGTTSIEAIGQDETTLSFDLMGRASNAAANGLTIRNGRIEFRR